MPLRYPHLYAHLGVPPPRGILLHGPPGCAKTALARAAAAQVGVSLTWLSCATLFSAFVGEAERVLRAAFLRARRNAPGILFLDELDAMVGDRGAAGGGRAGAESVELRVLASLLTEMDGISESAGVLVSLRAGSFCV